MLQTGLTCLSVFVSLNVLAGHLSHHWGTLPSFAVVAERDLTFDGDSSFVMSLGLIADQDYG